MESRKHKRFVIQQMIETSFDREKFIQAEGLDISEGGMRCRCSDPIEPLSRVYLMLRIPQEGKDCTLETKATVAWVREEKARYLYGLIFDDLSEEEKGILRNCLKTL